MVLKTPSEGGGGVEVRCPRGSGQPEGLAARVLTLRLPCCHGLILGKQAGLAGQEISLPDRALPSASAG